MKAGRVETPVTPMRRLKMPPMPPPVVEVGVVEGVRVMEMAMAEAMHVAGRRARDQHAA